MDSMNSTGTMNNSTPMNSPGEAPGDNGGMSITMQMAFDWGKEVTLLFNSWQTKHLSTYLLTLVVVVALAVLHKWLSSFRIGLASRVGLGKQSESSSLEEAPTTDLHDFSVRPLTLRWVSALLFGLNSATGYFLMLIIMSYNGGVFIAVLIGLILGHFIFDGKSHFAAGNDVM